MTPERQRLLPPYAALCLIAFYFAAFAPDGLRAYFTLDDGLNIHTLHAYWENSSWDVLRSVIGVATRAYRPVGGLVYLSAFRIFGFDPLPFRAICLSIMLLNLVIAFYVLKRLSSST